MLLSRMACCQTGKARAYFLGFLGKKHALFATISTSRTRFSSITGSQKDCHKSKTKLEREEQKGAWNLLSALEKSKESQLVDVVSLVTYLETLLPRTIESASSQPLEKDSDSFFSFDGKQSWTAKDIRALLDATRSGQLIEVSTVRVLIEEATIHFRSKYPDRLVHLPSLQSQDRIQVIGDLHGSLSDLSTVLALMPSEEPTAKSKLLFNGDLADRGDHGIEVICIVCAMCLAYPDFVHVNRGNHEDLTLSIAYGLAAEITSKYGAATRKVLRPSLDAFFRSLPLATIVEKDALIVHAGPPPPTEKKTISELLRTEHPILTGTGLSRTVVETDQDSTDEDYESERSSREIIEAMLWSDPILSGCGERLQDSGETYWIPNTTRGAGWKYDASVVRDLLNREGLFRMIRSHEPVQDGCARYEINNAKDTNLELFTVFSASKYPYKEGFNQGAILELKAERKHTIRRYSTDDDEAIPSRLQAQISSSSTLLNQDGDSNVCAINPKDIQRSLRAAIAYNRLTVFNELRKHCSKDNQIPFETVVDVLIDSMRLGAEAHSLKQIGAKIALAKALGITMESCLPPEMVNFDDFSEVLLGAKTPALEGSSDYSWLFSIFELIDTNHDGFLSRSEWGRAVGTINERLPEGIYLHGDHMWDILDANRDGKVSMVEWEKLARLVDELKPAADPPSK